MLRFVGLLLVVTVLFIAFSLRKRKVGRRAQSKAQGRRMAILALAFSPLMS